MTDVFFKGLGSWFALGEEGASVIVPSYGANGVFSLSVSDEITYNHTGNLTLNVSMLHPTNHPDSEFSRLENLGKTLKMGGLGDIGSKYTANNCFFVMDEGQPRDKILVIASPYKAIPEAEAVGDAGTGNHAGTETKGQKLTVLEKQQAAILKAIEELKLKPMAIPDGKKTAIRLFCENNHASIFKGSTSFDRAWKDGIKTLWQMEYHESYARRGNN
jgi:hypothetical protein